MHYDFSIIVPIFKNEENIGQLFNRISVMHEEYKKMEKALEFVLVLDGSPDSSLMLIKDHLARSKARIIVINLWTNLGSAKAIRVGMTKTSGKYIAVMSADLQEPLSLFKQMFDEIEKPNVEIVLGVRKSREDPHITRALSGFYWRAWSWALDADMPSGGADVFCLTLKAKDFLISKNQHSTALVASIIDLKIPLNQVYYNRAPRASGKSSWTLKKKIRLASDSIYGFTNLPVRLINLAGISGLLLSMILGGIVLIARLMDRIDSPGFATLLITILFTNSLIILSISIVANYIWRIFVNSQSTFIAPVSQEIIKNEEN